MPRALLDVLAAQLARANNDQQNNAAMLISLGANSAAWYNRSASQAFGIIAMANVSIAAVAVLARQAALALVKDELQRRGIRSVPSRDIHICADQLLRERPELVNEARDRALQLGLFERKPRCLLIRQRENGH